MDAMWHRLIRMDAQRQRHRLGRHGGCHAALAVGSPRRRRRERGCCRQLRSTRQLQSFVGSGTPCSHLIEIRGRALITEEKAEEAHE